MLACARIDQVALQLPAVTTSALHRRCSWPRSCRQRWRFKSGNSRLPGALCRPLQRWRPAAGAPGGRRALPAMEAHRCAHARCCWRACCFFIPRESTRTGSSSTMSRGSARRWAQEGGQPTRRRGPRRACWALRQTPVARRPRDIYYHMSAGQAIAAGGGLQYPSGHPPGGHPACWHCSLPEGMRADPPTCWQ